MTPIDFLLVLVKSVGLPIAMLFTIELLAYACNNGITVWWFKK